MTKRLEGKVAIVTGATAGMGRATAELFAREGCKVVLVARRQKLGNEIVSALCSQGLEAVFIKGDVSSSSDIRMVIKETIANFGKIDILFNNAGVNNKGVSRPDQESEDQWDALMDVNLKSAYLFIKYVAPVMRENGGGSIINNSSVLDSLVADSSSTSYHVSKGGLKMLTKKCAVAYASDNIRCNSIQPGAIATEMSLVPWDNLEDPDVIQGRERMQPLVRMGHPNDVAFAALYFASDESAFVTGAELLVDGGQSVKYK